MLIVMYFFSAIVIVHPGISLIVSMSGHRDALEAGGLRQICYDGHRLKEHPLPVIEVDDTYDDGNDDDSLK
jgi:hypothetical protein